MNLALLCLKMMAKRVCGDFRKKDMTLTVLFLQSSMAGCFTWDSLGPLIRLEGKIDSKRYIEEVLQSHLLPFLQILDEDYEFQQDNASIHKKQANYEIF